MTTFELRGDSVTLAQAIKAAGITGSGGQAKALIRDEQITVNGMIEKKPGRKLIAGDQFGVVGGAEWIVTRPK